MAPLAAALLAAWPLAAAKPELRGLWVARDSMASRETIAAALDNLKQANFNAVFVNVWSRGYPLWKSQVFERETGLSGDPGYAGRDVLAEFIEEAAQRGVAVIPWVEYGFVAGYSGYYPGEGGRGPVFDKHPEWLAKKRDGSVEFPVGSGCCYYWLAHENREARGFLLDLMEELTANYSIPAIQFDRARYPQLDCGYDDATVQTYMEEHDGNPPPQNPGDAEWMRWRADKLNDFSLRLFRRVRAANWRGLVTNAPVVYPYSYANFLQEYPAWMKAGALDFVSPQVYRSDLPALERELAAQVLAAGSAERLVPGLDITSTNAEFLIKSIELVRQQGMPGFVVWYYEGLVRKDAFLRLKETVLAEPAPLPWK